MKTMTNLVIAAYKGKYRIQKEIDVRQLEIVEIEHQMSGLAKSGIELSPEQKRSSKPMPHTVSHGDPEHRLICLVSRKEELEKEIDYLTMSMKLAEKIDQLPLTDQLMIYDLYHTKKSADQVASEYGYSKPAMYRHLYGIIDCIS